MALPSKELFASAELGAAAKRFDLGPLAHTHDLRLPDWGSYNNVYNGISHVADLQEGVIFGLSVFPGFFRREVLVPNVKWASGYHPWEAAPDLSYFSYRYELLWKDQLYCDVSFSALDGNTRLIRASFTNRTAVVQNTSLHYMGYLFYPRVRPYSDEVLQRVDVTLPAGAVWANAVDYKTLEFGVPRPTDGLVSAGKLRGEVRDQGFVCGSGIGTGFGKDAGDRASYEVVLPQGLSKAALLLRYRTKTNQACALQFSGAFNGEMRLKPSTEFALEKLTLGKLPAGPCRFELRAAGGASLELDGFAFVEAGQAEAIQFKDRPQYFVPEIRDGPVPQSVLLKYKDLTRYYGLKWKHDLSEVREIRHSELDRFFRRSVQNHIHKVITGDGKGHFTNIFIRPLPLPPNTTKVVYGLATVGSKAEVEGTLRQTAMDEAQLEEAYEKARSRRSQFTVSPAGEPYRFSQEKMAATTLSNVVFPIYAKRSYFRHNTPGKFWDSLYTWDSGFIGLGLMELDLNRAVECLNAYTTEPGDPQTAFLHIGTPLPVQIFQFWELWNRTQAPELLEYFYPRMRQYHQFLAGRINGSTTRRLKSNLLTTWDYFYNTGWDNYPPQKYMHEQGLVRKIAPVITTAVAIRTAKMLRSAAKALGETKDAAIYDEDIGLWTEAIQKNCWDAEAGYYSYVMHDEAGRPKGIMRHPGGQNFNLGMDGVTPIIAGIGTDEQFQAQLKNLRSDKHLWTQIGLSTVDQSAVYYRRDGYWNGAVWMPHQWFIWKSLLDWGQGDFAFQIAQTALELWKNEVNESYHCFEHFLIDSRRGAGWHQFSSLSAPVLNWFSAYYVPGRLTTGFDVRVRKCAWQDSNRALDASLELSSSRNGNTNFIAVMNPGGRYAVTWKETAARFRELLPGLLQVEVLNVPGEGRLRVVAL